MNKIIIPIGYMGSGSSAITDFMREFDGCHVADTNFEYVFLHCPNGVFDLEDKLLVGNNAVRSDEAIHSFENMMYQLYYRKFWWVGNYKKNLGADFKTITDEYINEIVQFIPRDYWYMQERLNFPRFLWMGMRAVLRKLSGGKIQIRRPLEYRPMRISLLRPEEFYTASKKFIERIITLMGREGSHLVLDQLLLPHNLWRVPKYFGEEAECFVVDRDPRDVYLLNKYVWPKESGQLPYPAQADEFCDYYLRLREMERETDCPQVHRIRFEDFVYQYEKTADRIMETVGLLPEQHARKRMYFDPDRSVFNTQLFLDEKYRDEIQIIEKKLGKYLYDFPYKIDLDYSKMF